MNELRVIHPYKHTGTWVYTNAPTRFHLGSVCYNENAQILPGTSASQSATECYVTNGSPNVCHALGY